ncbi:MAG: HIT domain-containing protein [Candidatus Omnitrophota bacterium]
MDRLWAPWRIKYLKIKKQRKCVFCRSLKSKNKNYIIFKSRYSFSMLNIFPYNNGHVLISPMRHVRDFSQLKDVEILDLCKTLDRTQKLLNKVLKPHGYNIGINISAAAGAGVPGHLHIHIVPRWRGDTNFMPTLYQTKVIAQSLDELYKRLKKYAR